MVEVGYRLWWRAYGGAECGFTQTATTVSVGSGTQPATLQHVGYLMRRYDEVETLCKVCSILRQCFKEDAHILDSPGATQRRNSGRWHVKMNEDRSQRVGVMQRICAIL
jgi:hypothetical protein